MQDGFRYSLNIHITSGTPDLPGFMNADVLVWRDGLHVLTVDIAGVTPMPFKFENELTVQAFASFMARYAALVIDEKVSAMQRAGESMLSAKDVDNVYPRAPK